MSSEFKSFEQSFLEGLLYKQMIRENIYTNLFFTNQQTLIKR